VSQSDATEFITVPTMIHRRDKLLTRQTFEVFYAQSCLTFCPSMIHRSRHATNNTGKMTHHKYLAEKPPWTKGKYSSLSLSLSLSLHKYSTHTCNAAKHDCPCIAGNATISQTLATAAYMYILYTHTHTHTHTHTQSIIHSQL
jgi:hypothetical protein